MNSNQIISEERLAEIAEDGFLHHGDSRAMARELLMLRKAHQPELGVWYGSMPESNGKKNWTAILHRKGESISLDGMTIDRSEYPERVKYAADRVRYLLGELVDRPSISNYDSEKHSGYVARVHPNEVRQRLEWLISNAYNAASNLDIGDDRTAAFELYEVLRRLQRRGAASEMLAATNPLLVDGHQGEPKPVPVPSFDGYIPHVAHELQAAFISAVKGAGLATSIDQPSVRPDPSAPPELINSLASWERCQSIADVPEVDAALRELVEDTTNDNGVRVVQAVIEAVKVVQ